MSDTERGALFAVLRDAASVNLVNAQSWRIPQGRGQHPFNDEAPRRALVGAAGGEDLSGFPHRRNLAVGHAEHLSMATTSDLYVHSRVDEIAVRLRALNLAVEEA